MPMGDAPWAVCAETHLEFPAEPAGLVAAGPDFLTTAFQRFGVLGPDNRVTRIENDTEWHGGSTGRKLALDVEYAHQTQLPTALFVKFFRDMDVARAQKLLAFQHHPWPEVFDEMRFNADGGAFRPSSPPR